MNCALSIDVAYYNDCMEALELGQACSGVYTIRPDNLHPFDVYCDMDTDGGGWAVFQFRMDGTQDFFLNWDKYVRGFGDLNAEFWLGLSKIHRLAASNSTELRVDLADFEGHTAYAKYSSFMVADSDLQYMMTVSGYSGNAGDAFGVHSGQKFSTKDRDNDVWPNNCAEHFMGAWWYRNCHASNLNGLYLSGYHSVEAIGVNWRNWPVSGYKYSLKATEMKVRHRA